MNLQNILKTVVVTGLIALCGCSSGGGGSSTPAPAAPIVAKTTTTISGKVEFPSLSSLVAKRAALPVDTSVTIQAYKLSGDLVGAAVNPTLENGQYVYNLLDMPIGTDYVIKATRVVGSNTQELKKLLEKADVVLDMPSTQSIDSVSTTAVVIASQKLTESMALADATGYIKFSLGDAIPAAATNNSTFSLSKLSDAIVSDVAPKALEASILSAKTNSSTTGGIVSYIQSLPPAEQKAFVDMVNMLNVVVTAVANNADPAKLLANNSTVTLSTTDANIPQLKLLSLNTDTTTGAITVIQDATAKTSITTAQIQETVSNAVVAYVPPRVKLEFSTNSTSLYGIVFEVTIPTGAKVRADVTGRLDKALITVPDGVIYDAQYYPLTNKVIIAIPALSNPLPAKIITLNFDRTSGVTLDKANFPYTNSSTSDLNGATMGSGFNLALTVTSSGL
jgi:hypothetical protein